MPSLPGPPAGVQRFFIGTPQATPPLTPDQMQQYRQVLD